MAERVGLVGGTGVAALGEHPVRVDTPWGAVEARFGTLAGREVVYVPRHGAGHARPAHRVAHRANVDALARCGATRVLAVNTVGGLSPRLQPGALVVPDDFIDLTQAGVTFFDDEVVHVDMTAPYCPEERAALLSAAGEAVDGGVYAQTRGPRLETPAEVRLLAEHADVVGMTGATEATLARERGLCYGSLCVVANLAAGLQEAVSMDAVVAEVAAARARVVEALERAVEALPLERGCPCGGAAEAGRLRRRGEGVDSPGLAGLPKREF